MSVIVWTRDAAAHLLRRAGFGGTPSEIDALYARGSAEAAVSSLVDYDSIDTSAYEAALAAKNYNLANSSGLTHWALDRMAFSPRTLEEKMTYMWNQWWTSGLAKVKGVTLMLNQNKTMRAYAMGKFDDLVTKLSEDPAMLVWLDNRQNTSAKPNENYARELMELFTLGVDNYTQTDVTEVARALTGYTVQGYSKSTNYNDATFAFNPATHDNGVKTILGQTGNWNLDDVVRIIVNRTDSRGSVSGRWVATRMWSFFAYPYPPDWIVDELVSVYVSSGRMIREVVRAMFLMEEFYAPHSRKALVRSPVEYVVASVRMLEGTSDFSNAANSLIAMGQYFWNPSDALGFWGMGANWLGTGTLFGRATFANAYAANRASTGTRLDPNKLLAGQDASTADEVVNILADRLNTANVTAETRAVWVKYLNQRDDGSIGTYNPATDVDKKVRGLVHVLLTSAAFHLA